jgi:transcriptional regulator
MYEPSHFKVEDRDALHGVIRAHPLGLLVTSGTGGLMANPVPFILHDDIGTYGTLRAHLARPNPQWREIATGAEVLVVFQGADHYITPAWYASKKEHGKVVPTWNYVTVQVRGTARAIEDAAWLRAQLDSLTGVHEGSLATRRQDHEAWAVGDAPDAFVAAQMRGIVGIEIDITDMAGKFKVSQNRPEADKQGVFKGLAAQAESEAQAMAKLVEERGLRATP